MSLQRVKEEHERLLWTVDEVAKQLHVSNKTVSRIIKKGELRFIKIGRNIRIQKTDVFNYLEHQKSYNLECVESVLFSEGENTCDSINVKAFTTLPTNKQVENRLDALLKPATNR